MSTLAEHLQAKAPELGRRAVIAMYHNPFWRERFGAGGREVFEKDSQDHLSYLMQALLSSDAGILTGYARSHRELIVSRGMCTRHVAESFERLEHAIDEEIADAQPAISLLRAARAALLYASGPARELMLAGEALAGKAVDALASRQPSWFSAASSYASLASFESITQAGRARCKAAVLELIAYLADALHAGRPELFVAHAAWTRDFLARRRAPGPGIEEMLQALSACLPRPSGAAASASRESLRPSRRPPLSQPPAPPVPLATSPELASEASAVLERALARLAPGGDAALAGSAAGARE